MTFGNRIHRGVAVRSAVLSLFFAVVTLPAAAQEFAVTDDWSILIAPAIKLPARSVEPLVQVPPATTDSATAAEAQSAEMSVGYPVVDPADYKRVYRSIPFSRAEYNANPSYRHDSTMEILTGIPRHQTIVKHTTYRPRPTAAPVNVIPYRYNNPDRGLNYYFYFPYWNYRGF